MLKWESPEKKLGTTALEVAIGNAASMCLGHMSTYDNNNSRQQL